MRIILPPFSSSVKLLIQKNNNIPFIHAIVHEENADIPRITDVVYDGMLVETINFCIEYEISSLLPPKVNALINKVMEKAAGKGCIDVMVNLFEKYNDKFRFSIDILSNGDVLSNPTVIDTILRYTPNLFLNVKYNEDLIHPLVINCHGKNNCSTFDKLLLHGADPLVVTRNKTLYQHCLDYLSKEALDMIAHLIDLGLVTREDILGNGKRKRYYLHLKKINERVGQNDKFLRMYLSYFDNKEEEMLDMIIQGSMDADHLSSLL